MINHGNKLPVSKEDIEHHILSEGLEGFRSFTTNKKNGQINRVRGEERKRGLRELAEPGGGRNGDHKLDL